jgi:hypothetical protein
VSQNPIRLRNQLLINCSMRAAVCGFLWLALNATAVYADDVDDLPVVKLTPHMRAEGHQAVFAELPCDEISKATAQTQAEQHALAQRKQECLAQYQQFIPTKALR